MGDLHRDDQLQQLFDGELSGEELDALQRELEHDDELNAKLEGLRHLNGLMQLQSEAWISELDSEDLWASVQSALADDRVDDDPMFVGTPRQARETARNAESKPALSVVAGGKKPDARPQPRTPAMPKVWVAMGALAVAAAVLLFVLREPGPSADPQLAAQPPAGSEVEEVDFGANTGSVFSVEGDEGENYAVVWISEPLPDERVQ